MHHFDIFLLRRVAEISNKIGYFFHSIFSEMKRKLVQVAMQRKFNLMLNQTIFLNSLSFSFEESQGLILELSIKIHDGYYSHKHR